MLNEIRNWAILLCGASIISIFTVFLVPEGNLKKTMNIVISLFIMSVVVYPFTVLKSFSFSNAFDEKYIENDPIENYSEKYNSFVIENANEIVYKEINSILSELCNEKYKIDIVSEMNSDGNVELKSVHILVSESDSQKKLIIKTKVGSVTGLVPEVEIINDER